MDFTEKHLTFQPAQLQNTIIFHYTGIADKFQNESMTSTMESQGGQIPRPTNSESQNLSPLARSPSSLFLCNCFHLTLMFLFLFIISDAYQNNSLWFYTGFSIFS